jgi:hypothetical protein
MFRQLPSSVCIIINKERHILFFLFSLPVGAVAIDAISGEEPSDIEQQKNYLHLSRSGMPQGKTDTLRHAIRTGRPSVNEALVIERQEKPDRKFLRLPRGRLEKEPP